MTVAEGDNTALNDVMFYCSHISKIHGNWGNWGAWTTCSESCGSGNRNRSRECDNPSPAPGGRDCEGPGNETEECNTNTCPGWLLIDLSKIRTCMYYLT